MNLIITKGIKDVPSTITLATYNPLPRVGECIAISKNNTRTVYKVTAVYHEFCKKLRGGINIYAKGVE